MDEQEITKVSVKDFRARLLEEGFKDLLPYDNARGDLVTEMQSNWQVISFCQEKDGDRFYMVAFQKSGATYINDDPKLDQITDKFVSSTIESHFLICEGAYSNPSVRLKAINNHKFVQAD